ncbi:hypothetical protein NPX13_g4053 [Xylaria arbuscula]|uniref:DUF7514 domain-containing protein n=1 Tax=Xylaria arbuscula TaxID=114810 RepID=A0A9W8NH41_9PEZI|nr:hypothetical protein NPX13_g4053 [Xylaria arbuscula]
MTNGKPQTQALILPGLEAHDNSRAVVEDATRSKSPPAPLSVASSITGGFDNPVTQDQNKSITMAQSPESRPLLGSRCLSPDIMDEIRKVIRQEFLGACTPKDRSQNIASNSGGASLINTDVGNNNTTQDHKRLPHLNTVNKSTQDESDGGSSSPTTVPGSGSDHIPTPETTPTATPSPSSTTSMPPLSLETSVVAKAVPPRLGVRFSDDVIPVRSPVPAPAPAQVKKAPWAMYRRMSSSNGEAVPDWGMLFNANGYATARCGQVLRGLAKHIADEFSPRGTGVVTPEKLGLLYSRFKIEGEVHPFEDIFHIFPRQERSSSNNVSDANSRLVTYYSRIGDFFADLDCEYYLVPPSTSETTSLTKSPSESSFSSTVDSAGTNSSSPVFPRSSSYSSLHPVSTMAVNPNPYKPLRPRLRSIRPCVPALTYTGFAQFYTKCLLAHPDEEAKRMNKIVEELALVADVGPSSLAFASPNSSTPSTPMSPLISSSILQSPLSSPTSTVPGSNASRGEKLPRQFVRSLLPVKSDANSRKILAAAVEDLLCDLNLPSSSSSVTSTSASRSLVSVATVPLASTTAFQLAEQNRRWSFANVSTNSNLNFNPGWTSNVPHLPPPPVPLPRTGSSSNMLKNGGIELSIGKNENGSSTPKPLPPPSPAGPLVRSRTTPAPAPPVSYQRWWCR